GKPRRPERIAEDGDFAAAILVFADREGSADQRVYAQQRKEIRLGLDYGGAFGRGTRADASAGVRRPRIHAHSVEGGVLRFPVEVVLAGQRIGSRGAFGLPEGYDFFG